nr:iron-containing alcohol dehydrogenase [Butyrivibrio sp.]
SAIDAAKAVAVGIVSEIDIEDFLIQGIEPPNETLPIIAIPTTSGTGAELTKGAIISSREMKVKSGIRGEHVVPKVAIVDPIYTYSLPLNVTMESGFDVFTHAAESYCAIKANPFSEMLSEKAIKIVGTALPRLKNNLEDIEAREMMSFASHIMGFNVKNVGNCLPHRLQYPIGVETETSHGVGLISLYPAWMKYEQEVASEKINNILEWLGCDTSLDAGVSIRKWMDKLGIYKNITELGNTLSADELAEMVSGNLSNDRLSDRDNIISTIYRESM